jgi:DNA-binding PadR family transcriptional regulator
LHGLENEGLVVSYWQEAENAPRRKYYQLTPKGRQAILEEQQQWVNVNRMLVKLWGPSPELAWS